MRELAIVAGLMLFGFVHYALGVYAVIKEMRNGDSDLFIEWMDRREARREREDG